MALMPGCQTPKGDSKSGEKGAEWLDTHQHFWHFTQENYSWIEPGWSIARDFAPSDLAPTLAATGVSGTIAVEARAHLDETKNLLSIAAQHEFVRGVVGWVPLLDPSLPVELERLAANQKLRGVRHAIAAEPDPNFVSRPDFNAGIALLRRFGLTYDLSLVPGNLPNILGFVDRHPDQTFVLDHLAKPYVRDQKLEPWRTQLRELGQRPNVYCKLSGLMREARWHAWQAKDFQPYFDTALEAFSPKRLMFGSDWPVCLLAGTYEAWLSTVQAWAAPLSADERRWLCAASAKQAYRL